MKKLLSVLAFSLTGTFLFAQHGHRTAPKQVQQAFHKDYPDAKDEHWSQHNGQWHADFNDHSQNDRGEMVAHYNPRGHHLDSHIPYDQQDVPSPIMQRIKKRYHGASDYRFERIEPSNNIGAFFQVTLNLGGKDKTVYMDENGRERKYSDRH